MNIEELYLHLSAPQLRKHAAVMLRMAEERDAVPYTEIVQLVVARFFRVSIPDITQRTRGADRLAFARQVAMYLTRKITCDSFPAIGKAFHRDHSTVIHACNLVQGLMAHSPAFAASIDALKRQIVQPAQIPSLASLTPSAQ